MLLRVNEHLEVAAAPVLHQLQYLVNRLLVFVFQIRLYVDGREGVIAVEQLQYVTLVELTLVHSDLEVIDLYESGSVWVHQDMRVSEDGRVMEDFGVHPVEVAVSENLPQQPLGLVLVDYVLQCRLFGEQFRLERQRSQSTCYLVHYQFQIGGRYSGSGVRTLLVVVCEGRDVVTVPDPIRRLECGEHLVVEGAYLQELPSVLVLDYRVQSREVVLYVFRNGPLVRPFSR